jgi:hypothetical protein
MTCLITLHNPPGSCECCGRAATHRATMQFNKDDTDAFVVCEMHADMATDDPKRFCNDYWQYEKEEETQ